ncbi:MAG TPA: anti-CBASS Acb1 family protein, partial [Methanosarcina sp.]|nr:anti-CBASS Acb1 family protein [Methanosarcina sp.]
NSSEDSIIAIKQTMKSIRLMYDLYGMVLHDSREQFNWNSRPVAGMDGLVNVHRDAFIGVSGMPHTKLFGESPGGLGRDGKETQINWANTVAEYQSENLEPRVEQLDRYIFLSKDGVTKGKFLEDYKRQYPSILRLSVEDVRAGRVSDIQALASGIQAGFITTDEARTVPSNSDWWPELNLNQEAWEEAKKKAEEQANSLGGFDMGAIGEEAPPEETAPVEEEPAPEETKTDSLNQPIKRVVNWQGLNIGVTHDPGDMRYNKTMMTGYGHIRGSYGAAEDSKAIDVYIQDPASSDFWKVRQLNPVSGELDETKYFIGFDNARAVKDCFEYHAGRDRFGGVERCNPTELNQYRQDKDELDEEDWLALELQDQLGVEVGDWIKQIRGIIEDVGKEYSDEQTRKEELEKRIKDLNLPTDSLTDKLYQNRVLADLAGRLMTEES